MESKWISVSDELPEEHGNYLAYTPRSFPKNSRCQVVEFYKTEDYQGWYDEYDEALSDVTHWQPLPDPPKQKE